MHAQKLPKFRRPPVIEVVHGVQFRRLPLTIIHPGLFYHRIESTYPVVQHVPPLLPVREALESMPAPLHFALQMGEPNSLPRTWFISRDDTLLIQLQADRLILNWRTGRTAAEYPHFDTVSSEFRRIYEELESFAMDQGLGDIVPDQCEMTYVNHIQPLQIGQHVRPTDIFRVWTDTDNGDWSVEADQLAFNARYPLNDPNGDARGRLFVSLTSLPGFGDGHPTLQLDLAARGAPTTAGLIGVSEFHRIAHEYIVRCFAGITTEDAHIKWERWQ